MSEDKNKAIGWDEEVENLDANDEYRLLEPGKYLFEVTRLQRGQFNGSEKMCSCPKAILTLTIRDDLGEVNLTHNLFLNKKCEGLLSQFFTCIGLRKHGDPKGRLPWGQVVGRQGLCNIGHRNGTGQYSGKQYNEIKKFSDPPSSTTEPQEQQSDEEKGGVPF